MLFHELVLLLQIIKHTKETIQHNSIKPKLKEYLPSFRTPLEQKL